MKSKKKLEDLRDRLIKIRDEFHEITDRLPDDAFMGPSNQNEFDRAHNGFPIHIGLAVENLRTLTEYHLVIDREMSP